ncbi:ATP-dependent DNA helicase [Pseudoscourfieldia marina]
MVYNCRHDACLRRVDPQPPTAADGIDADGPADERPADDGGHAFSVEAFVERVPHAHGVLQKHWQLEAHQLTSYQREACTSICEGADAYVRVRTGGGKSLMFSLPAVVMHEVGKTTLVVMPLKALIEDQLAGCQRRGIQAAAMHGDSPDKEALRSALCHGNDDLPPIVFATPELVATLPDDPSGVRAVVFDEAHTLVTWRAWRQGMAHVVAWTKKLQPKRQLVLVTATATPETHAALLHDFFDGTPPACNISASLDRPSITFSVHRKAPEEPGVFKMDACGFALAQFLWNQYMASTFPARARGCGIVYCHRKIDVHALALAMNGINGVRAAAFHGSLEPREKTSVADAWIDGNVDVLVATKAFGMGVDKPDVRFVVHWDVPASLDDLFQEAGRAARDGAPADHLVLYDEAKLSELANLAAGAKDTEHEARLANLAAVRAYCTADGSRELCRRRALLGAFGETYVIPRGGCAACDLGVARRGPTYKPASAWRRMSTQSTFIA